jgi:formate hydrogenlyase subunit 3/multisubunit Na+/H+ antiporter MnhD subunit
MNAPLLILLLGMVLALASLALRGRGWVAWLIAAVGSALLGAVALGILLGEPFEVLGVGIRLEPTWIVLGRSLVLRAESRALIGFIFFSGAVLLAAGWAADAPRRFASVGLLMLLALAAAMMVQPFVFAPTLIAAAAILGCLVVLRADGTPGRASPRLMVSYTLGMMAILIAGWMIEIGGVTATAGSPVRSASILLLLGLAILLTTPPFHTWVTASADEAHPLAFAAVAILLQTAGLFLLVQSLVSFAWLREDPLVYVFLRGVGVLMLGLGGLWCLVERRAARLIGYVLVADLGVSLLALSAGDTDGIRIALGTAASRPLSLALWAAGTANLFVVEARPGHERRIRPLAAAAGLVGAFSLAGMPLTSGFPGRWLTLADAQGVDLIVVGAVIFGTAATWLAIARWGWGLAQHRTAEPPGLDRGRAALLVIGCAAILALGWMPEWLFGWATASLGALGLG